MSTLFGGGEGGGGGGGGEQKSNCIHSSQTMPLLLVETCGTVVTWNSKSRSDLIKSDLFFREKKQEMVQVMKVSDTGKPYYGCLSC